ncbi:hypothetical protein [Duncaniella sp.]|uniref:hypothetical protein n=1 Tax=Duncaniella sp. TaxID=2518496 RepID=UPI0023C09087|nr:hypothetical protein [Duncaniella sp.]MDE5904323.1 hypothetical protein [Duncaniella sp.]
MKKVLLLLVSVCLLAGMSSCKRTINKMLNEATQSSAFDNAKDIPDVRTLNDVKEMLLSKCDTEKMPVYAIGLFEIEELSGKALFANVKMLNADRTQTYSQNFQFDGEVSALDSSSDKPNKSPIDLKTLDMNMIAKGIEDAKSQIPEGYTYRTVRNLLIEDGTTRITIAVTKDGEETVTNAGQTSEVYYNADFEIDNATGKATDKN